MKRNQTRACATAALLLMATFAISAERVHQRLEGERLQTGDAANALEKGVLEARDVEGAEGKVVRVTSAMNQWGFVNGWFGIPTPAGKATLRFRLYNDGEATARYLVYIRGTEGQIQVGELKLPADAAEKTFVDLDVAVSAETEWSGIVIKKADASDRASPWIDHISVVVTE